MGLHITCKEAVDYISKKEEKKLNVLQKVKLKYHLAICSLCKIFSIQNEIITKALSGSDSQEDYFLTEEKKEEIIESVLNDSQ